MIPPLQTLPAADWWRAFLRCVAETRDGAGDALAASGGLWLGASVGHHDSAASDEPLIHLERVGKIESAALTLPQQEYSLYYNGYADSTLWPLFHYRLDLVQHRSEFLHAYGRSMRALPRRSHDCYQAMMT
ncbi:msr9761 (plasmid) [Mesorhizobium japonicum MAFF 303099]|uniref:Msr9761 protein n=1 Tax=Mesorhizobium japonicum (strain LMG 29417 / CECT 9101 / MAFF 303099) TaxID=266835 RepID=Q98P66_RHILO|nr:msr9761 [Mesorhizobium japonicum MAFF 303099]